ncbi:myosin heavy chain, embryonic smooth muscle isoform-like [Salarias fasciatus]|uniref:myosin heavy chain, embryonic smooth muscle isoform-like n=1 Tax=Salarias fasciatus TaxID=181472 RepID=UPI00117707D5|nr:myosin heavy chain, embryonic smooth muscle isoform-like [Salarias fasciatus]
MAGRWRAPGGESEARDPASWRKFFVILTGRTNGAHQSVVKNFKSLGQTEARSPEDADYCLVFCPISYQVRSAVSEAMEHLPAGKAAVLVVMHHTFNPEQVIPPSRRVVTDRRVRLTVDCLFHQNNLLSCELNRSMKADIKTLFKTSKYLEKQVETLLEENAAQDKIIEEIKTKVETLQEENATKDERIKELETEVATLKQQVLINSRVNPPVSEEENGPVDQRSDTSLPSGHSTEKEADPKEKKKKKKGRKAIFTNCLKAIQTKIFVNDRREGHRRAALTMEVRNLLSRRNFRVPVFLHTETSPQAGPSGSEVIPQRKELDKDTESLKSQNAEVQAGHAQEKDLEKQNAEFLKELSEQTQRGALPVKSPTSDISVPTSSKGEPGSMDQ